MKFLLAIFIATIQVFAKPEVFVVKIIDHPALNETERGIKDALDEELKDFKYKVESAQGRADIASQIAAKFVSSSADIIIAIGTVAAQSFLKHKEKPVLFSSITDPESANLIQKNITGVSNFVSLKEQVELFKRLQPNLKRIAMIYNSGESNSVVIVRKLEPICKNMGIELVLQSVSKTSEISQATIKIVESNVDCIFISNDNTCLSAMNTIIKIATKKRIPVYVSDTDCVSLGCLAALGPNQYSIGKQTGKMALRVINGEKIENIKVEYPLNTELYINTSVARKIGINIDQSIINSAHKLIDEIL